MADVHNKTKRSYNMSRIRGKNTGPELVLRKLLFSKGIRGYRINYKITGKPDIAFTRYRTVIFVDGCFWHKCPVCYQEPEDNKLFWKNKIDGNVKRDLNVNKTLKTEGWTVIRFWEHLLRKDPSSVYNRIIKQLNKKGYHGI
jgi:DNA mismatch endonuclease (patch repair protein)